MKITRTSPFSGVENTLEIPCTQEQLDRWKAGEFIQRAMPDVSAELREFIMTGITPEEWDLYLSEGLEPEPADDDA